MRVLRLAATIGIFLFFSACSTVGGRVYVEPEEYYSIAAAYFDLGKYSEAERWFKLARRSEKTRFAAEYNLGRIAFESGNGEEAARRFEALLAYDPANATVLRAAAYSWMKAENWDRALALYDRIADLLPETEDARYNYALALLRAERYEDASARLKPYVERRSDDRGAILLLASAERKLGRPEAVDRYAAALALKEEASVRIDMAEALEDLELYARALESYRAVLAAGASDSVGGKGFVRFRAARVMLRAGEDPERSLAELSGAIADGFKDAEALRKLPETVGASQELSERILRIAAELGSQADERTPTADDPAGVLAP